MGWCAGNKKTNLAFCLRRNEKRRERRSSYRHPVWKSLEVVLHQRTFQGFVIDVQESDEEHDQLWNKVIVAVFHIIFGSHAKLQKRFLAQQGPL